MDVHKIWVISPDPDTRRLIGLNLNKRGFGVLETSPQDGLVPFDGVYPERSRGAQDRPGCDPPCRQEVAGRACSYGWERCLHHNGTAIRWESA
jgi:hypothetical protein